MMKEGEVEGGWGRGKGRWRMAGKEGKMGTSVIVSSVKKRTVVQYHNSGIDIDTVKRQNTSVTTGVPGSRYPFIATLPFFFHLHLLLNSWQPLIVLYFYTFVILRLLRL